MWVWEIDNLDVLEVAECLLDRSVDIRRRVVRSERLVTEDLDAPVVEIETDFVGDLPKILAVDQLDGLC